MTTNLPTSHMPRGNEVARYHELDRASLDGCGEVFLATAITVALGVAMMGTWLGTWVLVSAFLGVPVIAFYRGANRATHTIAVHNDGYILYFRNRTKIKHAGRWREVTILPNSPSGENTDDRESFLDGLIQTFNIFGIVAGLLVWPLAIVFAVVRWGSRVFTYSSRGWGARRLDIHLRNRRSIPLMLAEEDAEALLAHYDESMRAYVDHCVESGRDIELHNDIAIGRRSLRTRRGLIEFGDLVDTMLWTGGHEDDVLGITLTYRKRGRGRTVVSRERIGFQAPILLYALELRRSRADKLVISS